MKINSRAMVLTVGCLSFLNRPMHGAGKYLQVEYPPPTAANQLQIGVTNTMLDSRRRRPIPLRDRSSTGRWTNRG
jgi:hypothetical protein